ncbi:hypothetical protein ACLKA7_013769 [Drosophila subpalustris]
MGWVEAGLDKGKNVNRAMINVKANDINNRIERKAFEHESDAKGTEEKGDKSAASYVAISIIVIIIIIVVIGWLDRWTELIKKDLLTIAKCGPWAREQARAERLQLLIDYLLSASQSGNDIAHCPLPNVHCAWQFQETQSSSSSSVVFDFTSRTRLTLIIN